MSHKYLFVEMYPMKEYESFFDCLQLEKFFIMPSRIGRKPISPVSIIKALIMKNLKAIPTLTELSRELKENPSLALLCGFQPGSPIPSKERFSSFLRNTPNDLLQKLKRILLNELIKLGEVKGEYLSIDSVPIKSKVRENNLKTSCANRFNKSNPPKADSEAGLGVEIYFFPPQKKIVYFWGYRNHCIVDCKSELPVEEETKPANVQDVNMFIPLFDRIRKYYPFHIKGVLGDSAFDSEHILKYIFQTLKASPYIGRNPRRKTNQEFKISSGARVCMAGFEMLYWGRFEDRGKIRIKFVCPITHSKTFQKEHPFCPWFHPAFKKGNGCTAYLRADSNIRENIPYQTKKFVKVYNMRSGSERLFSRLLSLTMKNIPVKGLNAVSNHCTLAHITCLGIALAACKTGHRDKARYIKSFLPNLYLQIVKEQNL